MFEYIILNHVIKAAFHFEMVGGNVKRLVYDPFMYEHFKEHNISFKEELGDILVKTNFNIRITEEKLKETVEKLPFERPIIFDYKNSVIEVK